MKGLGNAEAVSKSYLWQTLVSTYERFSASDFLRKTAQTLATRVSLLLIGVITSVIVARILGPEGRGSYAVAVALSTIGVQLGNLGLHASNTFYLAKDKDILGRLVSNSLLVGLVFGGFGSCLLMGVFSLSPGWAPFGHPLLWLSLAAIPVGLTYLLLQNLLLGLQDIRAYNRIELGTKILVVVLVSLFIVLHEVTPELVFSATVISLIVGVGWTLVLLTKYLAVPTWPSLTLLRSNLGYGLRAYLAALSAFLVLKIDLLMVQHLLGPQEAGYYSIATALNDLLYIIPVTVGTILFPKLSGMLDREAQWRLTKKVVGLISVAMIVLGGIAALLAKALIGVLYGAAFNPALPAFMWLVPATIILSINTIFMNYFASIGMPAVTVYSPVLALSANVALNLKLIPLFGIVGASISSILAYLLMLGCSFLYLWKGAVR